MKLVKTSPVTRDAAPPRWADTVDFAQYARVKKRRRATKGVVLGLLGVIAMLAVWELASRVYDLEVLLPTPFTVIGNVIKTLSLRQDPWLYGPNIYRHLWASLLRTITGFGLAAAIAIPLGLLLGRIAALREFFGPVINILYPIPGIAWVPLAILWFGLGDKAVVFSVFMAAVFPLYFNVVAGVRLISPSLVDAGRCYGARGPMMFLKVILPAATPHVIVGLRIALGNAWRMIVAAEMFASSTGIGFVLIQSRYLFRAVDLMTAMILVSVVGYGTEKVIVGTIERWTIERWEVKSA
jgi:ABC-type nitrate/sulfonate/bicarbonate transport system permease component